MTWLCNLYCAEEKDTKRLKNGEIDVDKKCLDKCGKYALEDEKCYLYMGALLHVTHAPLTQVYAKLT